MTRAEYIKKFQNVVITATEGSGLFPSVMMAQAILESSDSKGNAGGSELASKYNNHFGVKAGPEWKGEKVLLRTREEKNGQSYYINDYFRVYSNPVDSFKDRVKFLKQNPRYTKGGVFIAATPQEQTLALKQSGYATAANYNEMLNSLIRSLQLTTLDIKKK